MGVYPVAAGLVVDPYLVAGVEPAVEADPSVGDSGVEPAEALVEGAGSLGI